MKHIIASLLYLYLTCGAIIFAQVGSLDGTFGTNGKVTTNFGSNWNEGYSVAIQQDGRIIVAGFAGYSNAFALVRYNTDGSLDNTFGIGGKVTTDFGVIEENHNSIAIQSDGKIVVAGTTGISQSRVFAVARYNTNGNLDISFGLSGKITTDFGIGANVGWSLAIQPDGRIVVAGNSANATDFDFALVRYNIDGTMDTSFNMNGIVTTDFGANNDLGRSVAIQPDGKIVVGGVSGTGAGTDFALARYNTDGTLDNTFSTDGKVTTDYESDSDAGMSVVIQSDGRIVMVGHALTTGATNDYLALARYNTNGTLDNSFGSGGKVITAFGPYYETGTSVAIQSDGKIIGVGYSFNGTDNDFTLARFNSDGSLDSTFGVDGRIITDFATNSDQAHSVAIQTDGKIVLAGTVSYDLGSDFAVARYISSLDIGIVDFSVANNVPFISPNPIGNHATLDYDLLSADIISIYLLDLKGRTIETFIEGQNQAAGMHQQSIEFSDAMPASTYLIVISSSKGTFAVQVER